MSGRVVVAHAGRQYSHQLAAALHARGALYEYWTGLPASRTALRPGAAYAAVDLPRELVRVLPVGVAGHFLDRFVLRGRTESIFGQLGDYAVDWTYSRRVRRLGGVVAAIVGYENASLATFQAARALGIRTILDAASVHHAAADRWMDAPPATGWARDVRRRKDHELEFADHVLVLSDLARETYVAAGVLPERISVVPLGYDPNIFRPAAEARTGEPLRFVFVGNAGYRKGFDLFVGAVQRLKQDRLRLQVSIIGDIAGDVPPGVEVFGKLGQNAIATELARADCLVLPSRCDSFGMVVAEALGSGVPAIVSGHVGARDVVTQSEAGWIVRPADVESLVARMRWCIEHPQDVLEAKRKARAAAADWTWGRYRARVADTVLGLVAHG